MHNALRAGAAASVVVAAVAVTVVACAATATAGASKWLPPLRLFTAPLALPAACPLTWRLSRGCQPVASDVVNKGILQS